MPGTDRKGSPDANAPRSARDTDTSGSGGDDAITTTGRRRVGPSSPWWNLWRRLRRGASALPAPEASPGRIGRYRVLELLGEGGMGRVYVGEDEALRRRVAVKILKVSDERAKRRFLREARAAARISHPNTCPIFEVGEDEGGPFLVMELLSGETLAERLKRGPLPVPEALAVAQDVLAGLEALHRAGIVHRDVKPSNVFLTAHGSRLLDFSLAREVPSDVARALMSVGESTPPGFVVGTPGYMAPEQILGHPVDPRADLFAAAAVLYEALTGRHPFAGDSTVRVLSAALYEEPPPLAGSPSLERLDAPVRRSLSKQPDQRFASAGELADALRAVEEAAQAEASVGSPNREPFVGRRDELAWLDERLAAAVAGTGSVAFVTGERGVGKSTLVGEFLRRVRSAPAPVTLVTGRCVEPQGPGEPFLPFLDALGRLLLSKGRDVAADLMRTYAPTICVQHLPVLLPDPDGALHRQAVGANKERLIREAGDFMEAAARLFPIVLYIEDLQWADAATVDLLHHLGCRIARQRTLIVGTYRHADVDAANLRMRRCALDLAARGAGQELALGALSREDLRTYLRARFSPNRFPPALADVLHTRTEGIALFARSLVDLLAERGEIVRDEEWGLVRPVEQLNLEPTSRLQDLVRQHLEALPEEERELLRHASVAGRELLSPVIAHLVGGDEVEVEERLRHLCAVRRLIVDLGEEELPDGTLATRYRFTHSLYQSVLYQDIVSSRRVRLHRQLAGRLRHHWGPRARQVAAEVAQHAERGRDFETAVEFRLHAGDNAAQRYAYDEAGEHYDWASRLIEKLPPERRREPTLDLHAKRGTARHSQARFDEAAEDFRAMLRVAREASSTDAEQAALAGLCNALFFARRIDEMAGHAQELLDAAVRAGHEGTALEARSRLGQVLICRGRFAEAIPLLDGVIEAARRGGPPVALQIGLSCRGLVHYWQAEYEPAEALMSEAAAIAADRGEAFDVLAFQMFTGNSRVKLGRIAEGLRDFLGAITTARRNGDRFWLPRLVSRMGWAHREVLAPERAREFHNEALRIARDGPLPHTLETEALLDLAVDEVRLGNVEQASALLTQLETKVSGDEWFRWMDELRLAAVAAEHWMACGDPERAVEHAGRLLGLARRLGAREYWSTAERIRAEVALARGEDLEEATSRLAEAFEELRRVRAPLETWKAARLLGRLHSRGGDTRKARQAFAEAARAVRTIAAGIQDESLRDGFLRTPTVHEVLDASPAEGGAGDPVSGPETKPAGSSP